ncbi:MAG: alpha/beta hydrolase [Chloroflexota bacterium]|nr:alpha/beta hydrolase [Chloroflexota bacterium]
MPQKLLELGGPADAALVHIAPANSFPPQTYGPMLRSLTDRYRAICFPPRALWGDQAPPRELREWDVLADDLLDAFAAWNMRELVLIGHSFGGIASMLAAIKAPERFRALVMLDPAILSRERLDWLKTAAEHNALDQTPLVRGALRRRRVFESRDLAFARFRSRPHFADWSDEALRLYVDHGLRERPNVAGFELAWPVEWEVYYYSTVYQRIWEDLLKLESLPPVLIIRGGASDTFDQSGQEAVQRLAPSATIRVIEGQGHLFPQSAPDETGALIRSWLRAALSE